MKRSLAVVEDDDLAFENLNNAINTYSQSENIEFEVTRFTSIQDFIEKYQKKYAVIFMDINLPDGNGMDCAFELRRIDKTASLVFVTTLAQYAQYGYRVDAVGFIVKPVKYPSFQMVFKKALNVYAMNEEHDFILKLPGGMCKVSVDKLMYVEIMSHRLYYHLVDETVEITGTLAQVESDLKQYGFLRCNNCYLVNPRFVQGVNHLDVLVGNEVLRMSRTKKKSFLEELSNWYLERMN